MERTAYKELNGPLQIMRDALSDVGGGVNLKKAQKLSTAARVLFGDSYEIWINKGDQGLMSELPADSPADFLLSTFREACSETRRYAVEAWWHNSKAVKINLDMAWHTAMVDAMTDLRVPVEQRRVKVFTMAKADSPPKNFTL